MSTLVTGLALVFAFLFGALAGGLRSRRKRAQLAAVAETTPHAPVDFRDVYESIRGRGPLVVGVERGDPGTLVRTLCPDCGVTHERHYAMTEMRCAECVKVAFLQAAQADADDQSDWLEGRG